MKKILIATHNPGKIKEYKAIFKEYGLQVLTLDDLGIRDKFEEKGNSFKANAEAKARFYFNLSQLPTMAEDSGFEIEYLNGAPGVKSRRWLGYEASDGELVEYLGQKIKEIPANKRQARFVAVSCLILNEGQVYFAQHTIEGYLTDKYNGSYKKGFPYRAFFLEKQSGKYLMELSREEYAKINHRRRNAEELVKIIN